MYVSFGKRILKGFNFRLGWKLHGWTAIFGILVIAMFYMTWWSILACGYLMYGFCYLCFYLPGKGIVKLIKKLIARRKEKTAQSGQL